MRTISPLRREARATFILALPMAGTQLAQVALQFIDNLMCGQLGTQALAGVGLGSAALATLLLPLLGLMGAVSPMASQAHGAEDLQALHQTVRQGLVAAVCLAPVAMLLLQLAPDLLLWMGNPPESVAQCRLYLQSVQWCLLPALLVGVMRAFLDSLSRPRFALYVALGAIGINITCNWLLMFGHWGFPRLGVAGTGWATTAVNLLSALALGLYIGLQKELRSRFWGPLQAPLQKELLKIGTPMMLAVMAEVWLFTGLTFVMGKFGSKALAAHQIALNLSTLTFMFAMGVSNAATVRVGQAMGRQKPLQARQAGAAAMLLGMGLMACSALAFWWVPHWFIGFFIPPGQNPDVTALAVRMLHLAALFQIFDALQVTSQGALRGIKDTFWPMLIGFGCYWGVGFGSSLTLAFSWQGGPVALWQGLVLGLMAASLFLSRRFFNSFPRGLSERAEAPNKV